MCVTPARDQTKTCFQVLTVARAEKSSSLHDSKSEVRDLIVGWGLPEGGIEAWLITGSPFDEVVLAHE